MHEATYKTRQELDQTKCNDNLCGGLIPRIIRQLRFRERGNYAM